MFSSQFSSFGVELFQKSTVLEPFYAKNAKFSCNYLKMSGFSSRNVRYPRYQDTDLLQLWACFLYYWLTQKWQEYSHRYNIQLINFRIVMQWYLHYKKYQLDSSQAPTCQPTQPNPAPTWSCNICYRFLQNSCWGSDLGAPIIDRRKWGHNSGVTGPILTKLKR